MSTRFLATLALLATIGCAHAAHRVAPADAPTGQLPRLVEPTSYDLTLSIDPRHERFGGEVRIALHVNASTDTVWIHGRDLKVSAVKYFSPGAMDVVGTYEQVDDDGLVRLHFPVQLHPGDGTLYLSWKAPFDTAATGLYRVHDGDADYAFTQFEAQWARKAFPCFDEPSFKVPFDIKLIVPVTMKAISNTPISNAWNQYGGGQQLIHFKPTPPLPTYLVAFAVGPFDVVQGPDIPASDVRAQPIPLRGVATKGKGKMLAYALQHAGEFVTILERYFGIAYPYPKLDLIAVPDFAAGAMENAGAITFKEFLLLMDEAHAPVTQKRAFVSVTMHELAHQWFGDLVTTKWWDDIWLNEAFATWMAARSVDEWNPAQKASLDQLMATHGAMSEDRRASARAIRQPIHSSDDVENAFDGITYRKGAAVIGMFERWVGVETFRKGIHNYLNAHRFGNATADDFLAAISQAAGRDVSAAFHSFLDQPGLPLLDIQVSCAGGKPGLDVRMSRYAPLGSKIDPKAQWQVPFCYRYRVGDNESGRGCELLTSPQQHVDLATDTCPSWVMPNADGQGYYVFALDKASLHKLAAARESLNEREQLSFANNIQLGQIAGRVSYAEALTSLAPFAESHDWRLAQYPLGEVQFARERLVSDVLRPTVEAYARELLKKAGPVVQLASDEDVLYERTALGFALDVARDPETRRRASEAGKAYLDGAAPAAGNLLADPSLIDLALDTAVEDTPGAVYDTMVQRLKTNLDPIQRRHLLSALGNAQDQYAERSLALALDPSIRPSEVPAILFTQASRRETRAGTWTWLMTHYDEVAKRLPEGGAGRLPWMGNSFCSEERANEVQKFFARRAAEATGGPRNLAQSVEEIELCAAQVKAEEASARSFFESWKK